MEVNVILFDDFETMDAFGPVQVFGSAPEHFHIKYLSVPGNIVNSMQGVKVWTEPLEADEIQGIVVIPGGRGARRLLYQDAESLRIMKRVAERAETCLMIGSGSALLAQTGVLFRRNIAECKADANWKRMFTGGISIVSEADWVADGKFYSSSSTVTGIDMALGVVADMLDLAVAEQIAQKIGYHWDANNENVFQ